MKKIVVLLGILLCGTGVAFAQSGLRVGDNYISISLGGGNSTDKVEQVNWGNKGGFAYGVQIMTLLSPQFAFGFGVEGTNFSPASTISYYEGYKINERIDSSILNVMLAGRFYITQNASRIYIPIGMGMGRARFEIDYFADDERFLNVKESSTGHAWYVGLGIESEFSNNVIFGIEGRLNGQNIEIDLTQETYDVHYITVAARLGYKF